MFIILANIRHNPELKDFHIVMEPSPHLYPKHLQYSQQKLPIKQCFPLPASLSKVPNSSFYFILYSRISPILDTLWEQK